MDKTILVTRSSMPELEEYMDEISDMWDSHWLTNMGPKHKELQEKLKAAGVETLQEAFKTQVLTFNESHSAE